jgi:hypothetical protein
MTFDTAPLLLNILAGVLELIRDTSDITALVVSGVQDGKMIPSVVPFLLAIKS